jgi:hypothetical protein
MCPMVAEHFEIVHFLNYHFLALIAEIFQSAENANMGKITIG